MMLINRQPRFSLVAGLFLTIALAACAPLLPATVSAPTPIATAVPTETPLPTPTRIPSPTPTDTPEPTATASPTPLPVVDLGGLSVVYQLVMVDAAQGWAVTQNGILHTADAGRTWNDVTPGVLAGQGAPTVGSFLDATNAALLAVLAQDPAHAVFLRTGDGGLTWTSTTAPFGMGSLQMLDPTHGFALASLDIGAGQNPVAVYRTDDGGTSWSLLFSDNPQTPDKNGIPIGGDKNGLAFADLNSGWVTGVTPTAGLVYLYRSQDGGQTWARQDVPLAPGTEKAQFNTQPPRFFGGGKGVMMAQAFLPSSGSMQYTTLIYATADAGATWRLAAPLPLPGPAALATATDWFVWTGSRLVATHDGGQTWETVQPSGLEGVKIPAALVFATPTDGWLISVETGKVRLFHTTDSGQTWQMMTK